MTAKSDRFDFAGTRLSYDLTGSGDRLVFIHGLTLDRRMWDDQLSHFGDHFEVLTYDMRGFGASDPPQPGVPYSHAGDLHALLSHLGIAHASVVGLSMGGRVAIEFALMYPEAVDSLVLVDAAVWGFDYSPEVSATLDALFTLGRSGRLADAKMGWIADPLFAYSATVPGVAARLAEMVTEYRGWGLLNDDPHEAFEPPPIQRLGEIAAPTLVIVGEHDLPDFHAMARVLGTAIPNARTVTLPHAGHMANMDAPVAFNDLVLDFLTTT